MVDIFQQMSNFFRLDGLEIFPSASASTLFMAHFFNPIQLLGMIGGLFLSVDYLPKRVLHFHLLFKYLCCVGNWVFFSKKKKNAKYLRGIGLEFLFGYISLGGVWPFLEMCLWRLLMPVPTK